MRRIASSPKGRGASSSPPDRQSDFAGTKPFTTHRILIVDDDEDIATVFRRMIERAFSDVKVDVFTDPSKGLEHLRLHRDDYQMLLCDLRMPRVSGYVLAMEAKILNPDIVVVLVSAFEVSASDVAKAVSPYQVDDVIRKPVSTAAFVEAVRRNLGKVKVPN
jgi:DNA-binding NtrC family response regulator